MMRGGRRRRGNSWVILGFILLIILFNNFSFFIGLAIVAAVTLLAFSILRSIMASSGANWQDAGWWSTFINRLLQELGTLDGFVRELFKPGSDSDQPRTSRRSRPESRSRRDEESPDNR